MKAIQVLEREHRVIEHVASACGICAEVLENGITVPFEVLDGMVSFFRKYGDQYHRQEEEALLSMLREKGISSGSCPIAVINYENQRRKTLVDQLSSAVTAYSKNNAVVSRTLIETLKELSGFLPDHIWKEDYLLLPMADKILSEEDKRSLADSLHRIESQKGEEARRTADQFNAMLHRCMDNIGHATEAYVG